MGDPAREVDIGGEPLFLQGGLDRLLQLPIPPDKDVEVRPLAKNERKGLGEVLNTFLLAQAADVTDKGRTAGQRGGDGESFKINEMLVGDENLVTVSFKVPIRNKACRV